MVSYLTVQTLSSYLQKWLTGGRHEVRMVFSDNVCGYVWMICLLDDEVWCLCGIPFQRDLKIIHHEYSAKLPGSSAPSDLIIFSSFLLKQAIVETRKGFFFLIEEENVKLNNNTVWNNSLKFWMPLKKPRHPSEATFRGQGCFFKGASLLGGTLH